MVGEQSLATSLVSEREGRLGCWPPAARIWVCMFWTSTGTLSWTVSPPRRVAVMVSYGMAMCTAVSGWIGASAVRRTVTRQRLQDDWIWYSLHAIALVYGLSSDLRRRRSSGRSGYACNATELDRYVFIVPMTPCVHSIQLLQAFLKKLAMFPWPLPAVFLPLAVVALGTDFGFLASGSSSEKDSQTASSLVTACGQTKCDNVESQLTQVAIFVLDRLFLHDTSPTAPSSTLDSHRRFALSRLTRNLLVYWRVLGVLFFLCGCIRHLNCI